MRNENPGGRPKKYANAAERQRAFRARESHSLATIRLKPETHDTIKKIAEMFEAPETEVFNSLINFALLNRNWFVEGLFGKRLPNAEWDKK